MDMIKDAHTPQADDLLTRLRALTPKHAMSAAQVFHLADAQADTLRNATRIPTLRLPEETIEDLPGIHILRRRRVTEPTARQDSHSLEWVITVDAALPEAQQRVAVLRAFKQVIDAPYSSRIYHHSPAIRDAQQQLAGLHFAARVLMPRHAVELVISAGAASIEETANIFGLDPDTTERRLTELDLIDITGRIRLDANAHPIPAIDDTEGAS